MRERVEAYSRLWVLYPQAVDRFAAIYVFAMIASRASVAELGTLAVATAVSAGAQRLAPALVADRSPLCPWPRRPTRPFHGGR